MKPDHLDSRPSTVASPAEAAARLGRRRFIAAVGAVAGAATAGVVLPAAADVASAAPPAGASRFRVLPKAVRLADTRPGYPSTNSYRKSSDRLIRVKVAGTAGVPDTASAVVLTVTCVNFGRPAHVTCSPTGEARPNASNLNLRPFAVNANMVTVKVGSGGNVDVWSLEDGHKIVDVLGYYEPVSGPVSGGRFINLATPRRVHDSRVPNRRLVAAGSYTTIDLTASTPPDAEAAMINLTVAAPQARGHFTAMPYDAPGPPSTSSLNVSGPGDTRAAGVIVPITKSGSRRLIKVYARVQGFVIVDVFGYYTSDSSPSDEKGLFVPIAPLRLIDTRDPGQIGRLWPGWVVEVPIPTAYRARAAAIAMNITGVNSRAPGHFTVSGTRLPIPDTSNVNWTTAGSVVPNHAVSTVTTPFGFQVYSSHGAHVVADMAGYFVGEPRPHQLPKYVNPPPPPSPPEWVLHVPRLGLTSTVKAGSPYAVTNSGFSWHWTGTGYVGQQAHVVLFGHRTEYGGPYRYVHLLQAGDTATLRTGDGRLFTYRMVRRDLVWGPNRNGPPTENILAATRHHPGTTLSLVACSRTNWLPTSLNHRIVVTFELVSWRDV